MACQVVYWTSLTLLAYTFFGYQVIMASLGRMRRRTTSGAGSLPAQPVAVLIVACNEEARIGARVANLRASRLPLDIVVCSDGSTDGTTSAARAAGARVFEFPRPARQGGLPLRGHSRCSTPPLSSSPIPASGSRRIPSPACSATLPIPPLAPPAAFSASAARPPARARASMLIGKWRPHCGRPNRILTRASAARAQSIQSGDHFFAPSLPTPSSTTS